MCVCVCFVRFSALLPAAAEAARVCVSLVRGQFNKMLALVPRFANLAAICTHINDQIAAEQRAHVLAGRSHFRPAAIVTPNIETFRTALPAHRLVSSARRIWMIRAHVAQRNTAPTRARSNARARPCWSFACALVLLASSCRVWS